MTVIDASVAAKWYLPEAGSDEAQRILRTPQKMFAPALIKIEVTATILRHYRENKITETRAIAACEEWQQALAVESITLIPDDDLFADAIRLARELRHTFQDCLYLACSNRMHLPLITADFKFVKRAGANHPSVVLLPGLQLN